MKLRKGFTIIELMIVVVAISILAAIAIPNFMAMRNRAKEANIRGDAHTLQLAAEDFAVLNNGVYSDAAGDLVPLLPGAGLMANVFTGAPSEPQFGAVAAAPGEVAIQAVNQGGVNVGYTITGMGENPADGLLVNLSSGQ